MAAQEKLEFVAQESDQMYWCREIWENRGQDSANVMTLPVSV